MPKFHNPGTLRIIWYTHDGSRGIKDFELHEYALVREKFDVLLALDDVRRVVIMGYSGQNPYVRDAGAGGWGERKGKLEKEMDRMQEESKRAREAKEKIETAKIDANRAEGSNAHMSLKTGPSLIPTSNSTDVKKGRYTGMDSAKEGRTGTILDIEDIIERSDRADEEKRREAEEKTWKENDGLLSGEMV